MKPLRNNLNNKLGCGSFKPKKGRIYRSPKMLSLGEQFVNQKETMSAALANEISKA